MRQTLWLILVAALLVSPAYAFHDGGVAECSGCHSMHSAVGDSFLLVASDESSTCLSCHESVGDTGPTRYHISTPAAELANDTDVVVQRTPGGDFGWLRQDLSALASYYAPINNYGYERGHNIIAADNDYTYVDGGVAPGGDMPAGELGCESCHDPHGQARLIDNAGTLEVQYPTVGATHDPIFDSGSYTGPAHRPTPGEAVGSYRLLGGAGYTAYDAKNYPGVVVARVDSNYNRDETKAAPTRVSYGWGTGDFTTWGLWCATCHEGMHESNGSNAPSGIVHPTDAVLSSRAAMYNQYVKTGDLTGTSTDSFTSLVPFTIGGADGSDLQSLDSRVPTLQGPAGGDRMNCLSCHRAHAGGWKYILRWNGEAEFLTLGDTTSGALYPGVDVVTSNQGQFNRGYTEAQMAAAYYDRPAGDEFAPHQRVLCNKCHHKD